MGGKAKAALIKRKNALRILLLIIPTMGRLRQFATKEGTL
jgi:hypothetical protein